MMRNVELRIVGLLMALVTVAPAGAAPAGSGSAKAASGSTSSGLSTDASSIRCVADEVVLAEPAQMINNAVVQGSKLYLPDWAAGLRVVDIETGKDVERIKVLSPRATEERAPLYVASGDGGFAVSGQKKAWFLFDRTWTPTKAFLSPKADPTGYAILFPDRFVVYGFAASEVTGGDEAWLYVQYIEDGRVVPLMIYQPGVTYEERMRIFQFRAVLSGGVAALPDGGWVAVDPVSYRVFVFDSTDRLIRTFLGTNPRFHPPNLEGFPENWAAQGREAVFRWWLAQPLVKKPVVLDDNRIGVVVGINDGERVQRHELDIYNLDGTAVAVGLEIEGVRAGRVVVAGSEPGRLVLVGQDHNWPPGAKTSVWEVDIRNGGKPARSSKH